MTQDDAEPGDGVEVDGLFRPLIPDGPYWYAEFGSYESLGTLYPAWVPRLVTGGVIAPRLDVNFPSRQDCERYIRDFLGAVLRSPDD